jgi:hypothetical protein
VRERKKREETREREIEREREREVITKGSGSGVYQLSRVETTDACYEQLYNNFCVFYVIDEQEDAPSSKTTTRKARGMLIPAFLLTRPSCV